MSKRRKEADGPNLRKPKDPVHLVRDIIDHEGKTQGISSHRPGKIGHVMSGMKEIMKMRKKKWERYALHKGFVESRYPKDSSYLTTSKNMMDHKNPNYGCQTIFKPLKYPGAQGQPQCKACNYTSPVQHGLG
jgi:hypothetical protein